MPAEAQVSSPTFAIVNAYRGGRVPMFHADLYRMKDAAELYEAGIYDLLEEGSVLVVEWIDRVRAFAPEDWLEIVIAKIRMVLQSKATSAEAAQRALDAPSFAQQAKQEPSTGGDSGGGGGAPAGEQEY